MKQLVLTLAAAALTTAAAAQCTPDPLYADSVFGVWPDTLENFKPGMVNVFYSDTLNLIIPTDANSLDPGDNSPQEVWDKLLSKHRVLPLVKRGKRLYVAVSDPTNLGGIDEIKFQTGLAIEAIVVEEDKLQKAVQKAIEQVVRWGGWGFLGFHGILSSCTGNW